MSTRVLISYFVPTTITDKALLPFLIIANYPANSKRVLKKRILIRKVKVEALKEIF